MLKNAREIEQTRQSQLASLSGKVDSYRSYELPAVGTGDYYVNLADIGQTLSFIEEQAELKDSNHIKRHSELMTSKMAASSLGFRSLAKE